MTSPALSRKAQRTLTKILDAALSCYADKGIAGTSLEHVAETAAIARSTVYRYIANRDDLLRKVLLRDAERQQQEMAVLLSYHDSLASWLVDSTVYIMRGRRQRPINALLFAAGENSPADRIYIPPEVFYPMAERLMRPLFERAQGAGQIRAGVDLEQAVKWVTRITLSLIHEPGEFLEDEPALRQWLYKFMVPSLVKDTAISSEEKQQGAPEHAQ